MGRTACTEPQYLYKGALYLYLLDQYKEINSGTCGELISLGTGWR
jgi:hypothetical protein